MMRDLTEEGSRPKRIRLQHGGSGSARLAVLLFFFWVFLVLSNQFSLVLVAAVEEKGKWLPSMTRKTRLFDASNSTGAAVTPMGEFEGNVDDDLYGDDKRIIHTGPNPLHN
ncbi:hypothetical protein Ancab_021181 [Ancistrocladus abbreviatus]